MTNRSSSGFNTYRAPSGNFAPDVYGVANPAQAAPYQPGRYPARFSVQQASKDDPDLFYWKVELFDARGGFAQSGRFDEVHDQLASSTLDSRFNHHLVLTQLTTNATTPDPTSAQILTSTFAFGKQAFGIGSGANVSLLTETSATNPAVTALTFTPHGPIASLTRVFMNSGVEYVIVGSVNNTSGEVLIDLGSTPTSVGDNANLTNCTGVIQTPLGVLFYNYDLIEFAALSANPQTVNPTTVLDDFNEGGYALGLLRLGNGPVRAWWVKPRVGVTSGTTMLAFGSEVIGDIVSTNEQGADPQILPVPLKGVYFAAIWRNGLVATDYDRIWWTNGTERRDLHWNDDRAPDSDKKLQCRGFYINGDELAIEVNQTISTNGTGSTKRWIESYDYDLRAWQQISETTTLSGTGLFGNAAGGSFPVSPNTGFAHIYSDGSWRRMSLPPYGLNPFGLRKTTGAAATTGAQFASTGTATWPAFQIPGIEGWPMVVRRVSGKPDVDSGGTGGTPATVQVAIPGTSFASGNSPAIFKTGYQTGVNYGRGFQMFSSSDNSIVFELQPSLTINQQSGGTDPTRMTCQGFSIVIEGLALRPDSTIFHQGFSAPDNRG